LIFLLKLGLVVKLGLITLDLKSSNQDFQDHRISFMKMGFMVLRVQDLKNLSQKKYPFEGSLLLLEVVVKTMMFREYYQRTYLHPQMDFHPSLAIQRGSAIHKALKLFNYVQVEE